MKVLFLHANIPNYVTDGLMHGLRELLGNECVDVPRNDPMYSPLSPEAAQKTGNRGKILYGLLEDNYVLEGRRVFWQRELSTYDLIIVADVLHRWSDLWEIARKFPLNRIAVVDGEDIPSVFPYQDIWGRLRHKPWSFFVPVHAVRYFKRELISGAEAYGAAPYLPKPLHWFFSVPPNLHSISMSIPAAKITKITPAQKRKDFVEYIVDEEIAIRTGKGFAATGQWKPVFETEKDYIQDIQVSRFGITGKRGGWDCLRHYEYAANGCVMCFKDLPAKPERCAPFGLDENNCIVYRTGDELMEKTTSLSASHYEKLLAESYKWIEQYTTVRVAERFLQTCGLEIPAAPILTS